MEKYMKKIFEEMQKNLIHVCGEEEKMRWGDVELDVVTISSKMKWKVLLMMFMLKLMLMVMMRLEIYGVRSEEGSTGFMSFIHEIKNS